MAIGWACHENSYRLWGGAVEPGKCCRSKRSSLELICAIAYLCTFSSTVWGYPGFVDRSIGVTP